MLQNERKFFDLAIDLCSIYRQHVRFNDNKNLNLETVFHLFNISYVPVS